MNPKALMGRVIFIVQKGARQPQSHFRPGRKSIPFLPSVIALFKKKTWSRGRFPDDEMGRGSKERQKAKPAMFFAF